VSYSRAKRVVHHCNDPAQPTRQPTHRLTATRPTQKDTAHTASAPHGRPLGHGMGSLTMVHGQLLSCRQSVAAPPVSLPHPLGLGLSLSLPKTETLAPPRSVEAWSRAGCSLQALPHRSSALCGVRARDSSSPTPALRPSSALALVRPSSSSPTVPSPSAHRWSAARRHGSPRWLLFCKYLYLILCEIVCMVAGLWQL
jgi:hypothetical protein